MSDPRTILKQYWGFETFRPMQEEIIQAVLDGRDTLALLPTGGGKSLCFQVPALLRNGLCLVISPLIALMKDQVENLRRKGITALSIHSGMSRKEVMTTLRVAGESNCKFLYVSPERLETNLFKEYLLSLGISLIAVDEAHCISQWGYDFRPTYLRIAALREELPRVPLLALTASATPPVQEDICLKLAFKNAAIFRQSFARENLSFSGFSVDSKINKIISILTKVPGTAIIYCKSRKRCKQISDRLNAEQISSDFYHAGLLQEERSQRQETWIKNRVRVIVCTNAFGMGIDKPDVRTVIHADTPECLENYYQEAGRAGRDGQRAYAVLLHSPKELTELQAQPDIRFPPMQEIRKVYQCLVNYLQVPAGLGLGQSFDFDLADFIGKFKLDTMLVIHSLKALEQEGIFAVNEQVFLPSKLVFLGDKNSLYAFEKENPRLEPLIKNLLRSYSGIFDQPVFIQERTLASLARTDLSTVIQQLQQLHAQGVVAYEPQKEGPQLYFLMPRPTTQDLYINQENYHQRRKQFEQRIERMVDYTIAESGCRSVFIGNYFGDQKIAPCGICDHCLQEKNKAIGKEEFDSIYQQIVDWVDHSSIPVAELIERLPAMKKKRFWEVLEFLQSENKLVVTKGMIARK